MTTNDLDQFRTAVARLRDWLNTGDRFSGSRLGQAAHDLTVVLDAIDSIPSDRLNPWHTLTLNDQGWLIAHPITCDLATCPFNDEAHTWLEPPAVDGVYRWDTVDSPFWKHPTR